MRQAVAARLPARTEVAKPANLHSNILIISLMLAGGRTYRPLFILS